MLTSAILCLALSAVSADGVKVSERFGYDPEDSTRFLQAAFDSGLPKIVIDRQAGPWYTMPLKGASNQIVVFEPGAEIVAKRGAYHATGDKLLSYACASNVTLSGHGGAIRMWKSDYTNAALYAWSEWRHAISMRSCRDMTIEGLTVASSGGDGLYLGQDASGEPNRGIVLRDAKFLDNNRQGVSVITADGLLIENCDLSGTWGTKPAAGIDFEPNNPKQSLKGIRVRNCRIENNQGCGLDFAKWNLDATSEPMEILIDSCRLLGNGRKVNLCPATNPYRDVGGRVGFVNCELLDSDQTPDGLRNISGRYSAFRVALKNCTVRDSPVKGGTTVMNETWPRLPVYPNGRGGSLSIVPMRIPEQIEVRDDRPGESVDVKAPQFRSRVRFLLYSSAPGPVTLRVFQNRLGRRRPLAKEKNEVRDADGELIALLPAPGEEPMEWRFDAPSRGFYEIRANVRGHALGILATTVPIAVVGGAAGFTGIVPLASAGGSLYFDVPEETVEFAAFLQGGGDRERVSARLFDAEGKLADEAVDVADFHGRLFGNHPAPGLWRIESRHPTSGCFEDYSVDLLNLPPVFFLTQEKTWRICGRKAEKLTSETRSVND